MRSFAAPLTVVTGNTTAPATLRTTPNGQKVLNVTVATTPQRRDQQTGTWHDRGTSQFYTATFWNDDAEAVAQTLTHKGISVVLMGDLVETEVESKKNPGTMVRTKNIENPLIAPLSNKRQAVVVTPLEYQGGGAPGQYNQQAQPAYQNQGAPVQGQNYNNGWNGNQQAQPSYGEQWNSTPAGEDAPPF